MANELMKYTDIRVDGIEATGLDENYNLIGADVSKAILARGTDGKYILVYDCLVDIANANNAEIYTNRTKIIVEIN